MSTFRKLFVCTFGVAIILLLTVGFPEDAVLDESLDELEALNEELADTMY